MLEDAFVFILVTLLMLISYFIFHKIDFVRFVPIEVEALFQLCCTVSSEEGAIMVVIVW
jgi:hypothetical protein